MEKTKEAFFREAVLRICSSLDIEKALNSCLDHLKKIHTRRCHEPVRLCA
ncbi:MAG: hypothetical protein U9P10_04495 [Thermodesulfobacteriota bacterium]|nr:hypothetical protein [Thermodesulfobacteriota bacterium]